MRKIFAFMCLLTAAFAEEPLVPLIEVPALSQELIVVPALPLIEPAPVSITIDCPGDFHQSITALEAERAKLWTLMNEAKKGDVTLASRRFTPPDVKGDSLKMLNAVRGRNGVDSTIFTTHPIGDVLYRSLAEFKGFTGQPKTAGICAGAKELVKFYMERNDALFKRSNQYKAAWGEFLTLASLEQGETPKRASLIAAHYFLRDSAGRYVTLADGVKELFRKVEAAHAAHCLCK